MERILIIFFAAAGIAWNTHPDARPYVDLGMWAAFALGMFIAGVRADAWLDRLAQRRRWNRVD